MAQRAAGDDAELMDTIVQASFAVQAVLGDAAARHGLSITALRLLGILRDRNPAMSALAGFLRLDPSSVSGLVDRAQRRGLVQRQVSAQDRRVATVSITAAGLALGAEIEAEVYAGLRPLLTSLSAADRRAFARLAAWLPVPD